MWLGAHFFPARSRREDFSRQLISWATSTSFATACFDSSGVRSQQGILTQSFKQTVFWCFLKQKTKPENGVGRGSSFQQWDHPFSPQEQHGRKWPWAPDFVYLTQIWTFVFRDEWEKLSGQLGCWMSFFACAPVPPARCVTSFGTPHRITSQLVPAASQYGPARDMDEQRAA